MIVKLLTEHHLEFLSLTGGCTGSYMSLHLSKCHTVGNHVSRLNYLINKEQGSIILLIVYEK